MFAVPTCMSDVIFTFNSRNYFDNVRHSVQARSDVISKRQPKARKPICAVCHYTSSCCTRYDNGRSCNHSRYWNNSFRPPLDTSPRLHKGPSVTLKAGETNLRPLLSRRGAVTVGTVPQAVSSTTPSAVLKTSSSNLATEGEERKGFVLRFPSVEKQKERKMISRDVREMFEGYPYKNPEPHDHRPLEQKPRFLTAKTPDPLNIKLKKGGLSSLMEEVCMDEVHYTVKRPFKTSVTPVVQYQKDLYFRKGRYSPAYTAYEDYLSRVVNSLQSKGHQ